MENKNQRMLFDKSNYILVLIGLALIIIGFIAMMGGGTEDPSVYPEETLYGFRRTVLAPILIVLGYIVEAYAIMKKPASDVQEKHDA